MGDGYNEGLDEEEQDWNSQAQAAAAGKGPQMPGLHFCSECNNMLSPREDPGLRTLVYRCDHCKNEQPSYNPCIQKRVLKKSATNRLELIDPSVAKDKTLPRTFDAECPSCGGNEAVFFMSKSGGRDSDMALVFLCVTCHHKWLND